MIRRRVKASCFFAIKFYLFHDAETYNSLPLYIFNRSLPCSKPLQFQSITMAVRSLWAGHPFQYQFDSRFTNTEKGLGFRIGLGGAPLGLLGESCNRGQQISLPAGLNYLIGKKEHFLELGAGGVLAIIGSTKIYCLDFKHGFFSDETVPYTFISAGYRFQPFKKKGLTYRIFISPLFQKGFSAKARGGASFGYRF